ncbi:MAG TPA: hypothetical protein VJ836_00975 [Candidatus Saccharimonadales bacterium]|nr:hypothetical protein [Candidatus Saccharimonadales bacterium]
MGQWYIRIRAVRREPVDTAMLVQALLAFGRQLWEEEQAAKRQAKREQRTARILKSKAGPEATA